MSFTQKALSATFTYAKGKFSGGGNTYTASGLAMSARITTPGGDDFGNLTLTIYGLPLSVLNQLTILPTAMTAIGVNTITLMAGDDPNALAMVFVGTVHSAYADASAQPNVCLRVQAVAGQFDKIKPVPPTSVQGSGDVATIMGQLAKTMGLTLENTGVNVKLSNPYLPNSAMQQVAALARHAGIQWTLDGDILAIWPPGQARGVAPTTISPETGMVGYPAFTASGIIVTTEFVATLKFGAKVTVQSELTPACGDWFIHYIEYSLDCQIPNGLWFATLQAGKIDPNN